MEEIDGLFSQLSRLPGFRREKSVELWNYLAKLEDMESLSPWEQLVKLKQNLFRSYQEDPPRMAALPDVTRIAGNLAAILVSEDLSLRQVVHSHITAALAAKDQPVRFFRRTILGNQLLMGVNIQWWILINALQDGQPPTLWLQDIAVPREYAANLKEKFIAEQELTISISPEQIARSAQLRYLKFGLPSQQRIYEVAVTTGGILERLWNLSLSLAETYPWTEAQATVFVLTGLSPLIPAITHQLRMRKETSDSRVLIDIDPMSSPEDVAKSYLQNRHELVGLRPRDLSEKHLILALFATTRPQEEKWVEKMAQWNKSFPQWKYNRETTFGSDALLAQKRVLNPDYRRATGLSKRGDVEVGGDQGATNELEDENE